MTDIPNDSTKIQYLSLCAFMFELGYTHCHDGFYSSNPSADLIHYNTAVRLHNSTWEYCNKEKGLYVPCFHYGQREKSPFCIDGRMLRKALASKIVEYVYLQSNKHNVVTCQKQWVQFTNQDIYNLFKGLLK